MFEGYLLLNNNRSFTKNKLKIFRNFIFLEMDKLFNMIETNVDFYL